MTLHRCARITLAAAAITALAALWRDTAPRGDDRLSNRRRRYHARQWALGAGRTLTAAELATLREHAR